MAGAYVVSSSKRQGQRVEAGLIVGVKIPERDVILRLLHHPRRSIGNKNYGVDGTLERKPYLWPSQHLAKFKEADNAAGDDDGEPDNRC